VCGQPVAVGQRDSERCVERSKDYRRKLSPSSIDAASQLLADIDLCAFPDQQEKSRTCQYSPFHFGFHVSRCCLGASPVHSASAPSARPYDCVSQVLKNISPAIGNSAIPAPTSCIFWPDITSFG
jgi:hypothetical protein